MSIPANRIIVPTTERNFGRFGDASPVPSLTDVQTRSYDRFLQLDVPHDKRTATGLEGVLQEIFPIESYDKKIVARVRQVRTRQAALRPGRVPPAPPDLRPAVPRLAAPPQGGRHADGGRGLPRRHADHDRRRRVHHQRRRARRRLASCTARPAWTSSSSARPTRDLHSCRIIPERGSWIEINVTKKDTLGVRIDQSGKFSAHDAPARDGAASTRPTAALIREFYEHGQGQAQETRPAGPNWSATRKITSSR